MKIHSRTHLLVPTSRKCFELGQFVKETQPTALPRVCLQAYRLLRICALGPGKSDPLVPRASAQWFSAVVLVLKP